MGPLLRDGNESNKRHENDYVLRIWLTLTVDGPDSYD